MRIIGLDWGTTRVGIAMTDEEQHLAFPLQHTLDSKTAIEEIIKLSEEYSVEKIILGMPKSLDGKQNASTEKTQKFADKLKSELKLEIELVDERFSTVQSTKSLQAQEIKEKDQREIKDNIAAALLLQQYLDSKSK